MVRLVFRPYTQIRPLICTSKPLRASIRVSSDFALFRHSSPSFGSQHIRSHSVLKNGCLLKARLTFISPNTFFKLCRTRIHVRLLGPCFKTGRQVRQQSIESFRQQRKKTTPRGETCANQIRLLRTVPGQHHPLARQPPPVLPSFLKMHGQMPSAAPITPLAWAPWATSSTTTHPLSTSQA